LRSKLRLCSEFEKTGATITSSVGREEIVYRTEGLEESVPKVFELMADSIFNGRLHPYDLPPKKNLVKRDIETYSEVPEIVLNEALHRTAFARTLGNPIICPPHQLSKISTETIALIMNVYFTGQNISVIGSNIPHETLVDLSKEFLQINNEVTRITAPHDEKEEKEEKGKIGEVSYYKGGDCRINVSGEPTQAILAYEGVHNTSSELASFIVFAKLLGGTSFEGSDPTTKGRASLLNKSVMDGLKLTSGEAYHLTYSDAGLFAVQLKGDSESVGYGVFRTKILLEAIAERGVPEKEVVRAKNQSLLEFYSTFETKF
jgi:mitochondrial-processing peptidase subunit alpha